MPCSISSPGTATWHHKLLLGDPLDEYSVRYRRDTPLYSIEDLWNTLMSVRAQVLEGESRLQIASRNFDRSMLACTLRGRTLCWK
jgi:hypothetical protein